MYQLSKKKLYKPFSNNIDQPEIFLFLKKILEPEASFFWMSTIYALAIGFLALATPMSVQFLINSVSFTAMLQPIIILGLVLLILLLFWAALSGLQFYVTEIFQRRFFARMASEVGMSLLNSQHRVFEEANQTEMVNRFFETIAIQKTIPKFLTKTFALLLQGMIGLILVSFYHPLFLVFSLIIVASLWLIWSRFYKQAIVSSFYESRRKYDVVGWLEDIARGHNIFKSSNGFNYAKFKIDFLTGQYLEERKKHFKNLFSQVLLLLLLYVFASVALLVIGGFLVLKGQLTIGQLVAAELILSAILYGFSQLGRDFENFYDLIAACEKLSQFYNIPSDKNLGVSFPNKPFDLNFKNAFYKYSNHEYSFDVCFEAKKNYMVSTGGFSTKKILIDLIHGFRTPISGTVLVDQEDLRNLDLYSIRSQIAVIDNSPLIESSVGEYLSFNDGNISQSVINEALKVTGLENIILKSEDGLNMRIIPSGWPFSESEKILLQIARVLIHKPNLIIITEVLDMLVLPARQKILKYLTKEHDATVIYFSHRTDGMLDFDNYLFVDKAQTYEFSSIEKLEEFETKFHTNDRK